jgi:hypothetical protein
MVTSLRKVCRERRLAEGDAVLKDKSWASLSVPISWTIARIFGAARGGARLLEESQYDYDFQIGQGDIPKTARGEDSDAQKEVGDEGPPRAQELPPERLRAAVKALYAL